MSQKKRCKVKSRKLSNTTHIEVSYRKFASLVGVFIVAFMATFLGSSLFMQPHTSEAEEVVVRTRNSMGYSIALNTEERTVTELVTTATDSTAVVASNINVVSNIDEGYKVFISMDNADENGNRMYLEGDKTTGTFIAPTSGTYDTPAVLDENSWGYAVPGVGGFDSSYSTAMINSTGKFARLPLQGHEEMIANTSSTTSNEGDNLTVYFGAKGNSRLPIGTYSARVAYTAISNNNVGDGLAYVMPRETTEIYGGETLTITTSLTATPEALAAAATAAGVAVAEIKVGGEECVYTGVQSDGSHIVLTCTMPAHDTGIYDVAVVVPAYGTEYFIASGLEYKHYVKTTFDFWNIEYMQDMTAEVCKEVPTPLNTTLTPTTKLTREEQKQLVYDIRDVPSLKYNYDKIPQTYLKDKRDNKSYVIRKLADGNCWMAQNLALEGGSEIEPTLSNVGEGYGTWNLPASNLFTSSTTTGAMYNGTHIDNELDLTVYYANDNTGAYYNWCAAVANKCSGGGNATEDICPKNWRLPTYSPKSEFNLLYTAYSSNRASFDAARPTVYAGFYHSATPDRLGSIAYWHYSTPGGNGSYTLEMNKGSSMTMGYSYSKSYHLSIRCLVKE